jgi:NADPH-dependent 2,4-dienoyl-CoA reductase/sulfur reductase-like enzyme/rhodanese-related sulfurtransferase
MKLMANAKKIVVVGGSAAGPKAAARARRLDPNAEITIVQKEPDLSMASCGYPYYVGGFFDDRNQLLSTPTGVTRDPKFFLNAKGIGANPGTEVVSINRKNRSVTCKEIGNGKAYDLAYDKLILATGSIPIIPPLPGSDLKGITTLKSMQDADFLRNVRDEKKIRKAAIIGGGLIGVETCEALQLAGIEITLVEQLPQILMFLDWELAKLLENHIKSKAANVITDNAAAKFIGNGQLTGIKLQNGTEIPCDLAVIAVGVRPNTQLAENAGLEIGCCGGIAVNGYMQTSDPDIYAAGDCIEVNNIITGKKAYAPYGDLANLQGRVAGQNVILGNTATFPGTINTGICKVFDFSAGSTGLSESAAKRFGYENIVSVIISGPDKPGFMNGKPLITKIVADANSEKLLGVQCVGPGDVGKQISQAAIAIQGNLTISDIVNADLPYAPPFSLAIDNFVCSAHVLENKMKGLMNGISAVTVKEKLDKGEKPYLLDVRGFDEFEQMHLGLGETLIPLGQLRGKLDDLPQDKNHEIICFCKISLRGYEAARLLESKGWKNVKVMEGGILAWPFGREK